MSDDNFRLNRFEELFDYLEELTKTDDPDLQEVAITSLQAMINDQLAFVKNQFDSGRLPSERVQEGMRLRETPFVYGYLLGAGTLVGAVVGEEPGGTASIDAMRRAFAELYLDNWERNWKASQAVPEDDSDYATGIDAGSEYPSRRFGSATVSGRSSWGNTGRWCETGSARRICQDHRTAPWSDCRTRTSSADHAACPRCLGA
jgi:hypothetical protein